jgi:hypothetical protein
LLYCRYQRSDSHDIQDAREIIGEDVIDAKGPLSQLRHPRELPAVIAEVGDIVGDDQMVFGVDGDLDIVSDAQRRCSRPSISLQAL